MNRVRAVASPCGVACVGGGLRKNATALHLEFTRTWFVRFLFLTCHVAAIRYDPWARRGIFLWGGGGCVGGGGVYANTPLHKISGSPEPGVFVSFFFNTGHLAAMRSGPWARNRILGSVVSICVLVLTRTYAPVYSVAAETPLREVASSMVEQARQLTPRRGTANLGNRG
jgi:hypothetical protein